MEQRSVFTMTALRDGTTDISRAASLPPDQAEKNPMSPFASYGLERGSSQSVQSGSVLSITRSRSMSFAKPRKSFGSLYRSARSTSGELWHNSAVSESISDRHDIEALRDLCGKEDAGLYIDGEELKHVKVLGEGEFAGGIYIW